MNRNYKVIWNASLNCFMAVAEYAKSRGKSSSTVVSSSVSVSVSVNAATGGMRLLRLSALSAGLVAAGLSISPQVFAQVGVDGGTGSGTAISQCITETKIVNGVLTTITTAANSGTSKDNIAVGCNSVAAGNQAIVIGGSATTKADEGGVQGNQSVAIGHDAQTKGDQSVGLGANVRASGNSSIAIGGDDVNKVIDEVGGIYTAITGSTLVKNDYKGTESSGAGSTAIGVQAAAKGAFSTALGVTSAATGNASVALGVKSSAVGEGALAIGAVSSALKKGSVALGINSNSNGENSVAIGSGSTSTTGANASGENATSIGSQSSAAANATAIGAGAKATIAGGVAIGTGSVANIVAGIKGFDPSTSGATTQTSNVWNSTRAAVALGDGNTITRQLTGLAAGTNDSDAVNVAQLKTVTNQTFKLQANGDTASAVKSSDTVQFKNGSNVVITRSGNDITVGTSANPSFTTVTSTGAMNAGSLTVTGAAALNGGANLNNQKITGLAVGIAATDAVNKGQLDSVQTTLTNTGLKFSGDNTTAFTRKLGEELKLRGGATEANLTDNNIGVVANGTDTLTVKLNKDINLGAAGSVTTGNTVTNNTGVTITEGTKVTRVSSAGTNVTDGTNTSNYGANGLTITGGPSVTTAGINAGSKKITGVLAGSDATDAVNYEQLTGLATVGNDKINKLGGDTATNLGGGAIYNSATGAITAPSYQLDKGTVTASNVGSALTNLDGRTSTNTDNIATNAGNIIKAKTTVTKGDNIEVTASVNTDGSTNYQVATAKDLTVDSIKAGNSTLNNTGLTITGGPSVTTAGINAGSKKITGVLAGSDATDAVNFGQLDVLQNNVNDLTTGVVTYERNANNSVNKNKVIFAGTPAVIGKNSQGDNIVVSGGTTLTNIANGINAADAINKGQLDSIISKNITDVEVTDKDGDKINISVIEQVVNTNINNSNSDSLFLTYNKEGQIVTDRLTIGETVQKMNTEGVKFAHTNASPQSKGDIASGVTNDSSAGGINSTAIGVNAIIETGADSTVALGHDAKASKDAKNSVVIGRGSKVEGKSSIAIGEGAQALGNQSISIGTGNVVTGDNSGAFGDPSIIDGSNSYSVGNNNSITSNDTFVLGNKVTQTVEGSVVLGTGSGATTGAGKVGYLENINGVVNDAIFATRSTTGAVAVGNASAGIYRQITGVAAGTADSDAVNVSQLKAVNEKIDNSNAVINDAAVQYDKTGSTINKGSITLGGGTAGTIITNVANGVKPSDAVNKGQLDKLGGGVANIIGGDATYDADGNLTATNIGGTGKGNISDAIAAVNQGNAQANEGIKANTDNIKANTNRLDAGLSFGADNGNNINKPIGDSTALKFEGGKNITTTTTDSGIKFDLNGNISVDSVTTGNTTVNNNGVTIKDGPSMTIDGIYAGNKTITGVADGIKVNDAVNLGQLNALDQKISNSVNELGYKVSEVEDGANAGISAAMAMSSLPQAYIPGKSMIGGGIATYNGQSAVAVGISKVSDNGRWVIKANGTADTQGNAGGAIGAGFHF